jgi:hypothetical protein
VYSQVSGKRVLWYGGACGVCSRVSGKRLPGYGRAYGVCSRYWLHVCLGLAELGGACSRVPGALVLGGTADPVGCVVRYRARVCAWVWWSLSGV